MNLLKAFPEIDLFFKKNQFNNLELENFILEIKNKYSDKLVLNSALNLIRLELLKYTFTDKKNLSNTKENPISHKNLKINKEETDIINYLNKNSIDSISKTLKWKPEYLMSILKHSDLSKLKNEILEKKEFSRLENKLIARLKGLIRVEKEEIKLLSPRQKKHPKPSIYRSIEVYNKIKQNNGTGKIIYIRQK